MIRDRGNIKWTAMMLPEHVEMLKAIQEKSLYKAKPKLDEQRLEEMNEILCLAMAQNQWLCFTYFQNHDYHILVGKVHDYNEVSEKLRIKDHFDQVYVLKVNDIVDLRLHHEG